MTTFDEQTLIGITETEAKKILKENEICTRTTQRDGKHFIGTCDFRMDRVNLQVKDGKVIAVDRG